MEKVEKLNLNDFFDKHGIVILHFNEENFKKDNGSIEFENFKGKWLFSNNVIKSENKEDPVQFTVKCSIIYPESIIFNEKEFDLQMYHDKLTVLHRTFCEKYPELNFPDIFIVNPKLVNHTGSCIVFHNETKQHFIYLNYNDLENIDVFSFTIGHELGHVIYRNNEKENSKNLEKKRFTTLFPWEFAVPWFGVMVLSFMTVLNQPIAPNMFLFLSGMILYITFYLFLAIMSFPRFLNYQNEFHSDRFALELDPEINLDNIADIFTVNYNSYTHPSCELRFKEIKNHGKGIYKNPVLKYWGFRFPNGIEMRITLMLLVERINKLLSRQKRE